MVFTATQGSASTAPRNLKAEAKISGLRGVFLRLVQEHGELTTLLLTLKLSSDSALRAELFPTLREHLLAHERAEAEVLYSAMSKKEGTRLIAAKHQRVASETEALLERLSTIDYTSERWERLFNLLFVAVERHIIEEESYYFPIAQRVLGDSKTHALRAPYETARSSNVVHTV